MATCVQQLISPEVNKFSETAARGLQRGRGTSVAHLNFFNEASASQPPTLQRVTIICIHTPTAHHSSAGAINTVTPADLYLHSACHLMFLTNVVSGGIKARTNSPDEVGLANLLMASSSWGPLDKQQCPPLFKAP